MTRVIARGSLRIDARKAVEKLREHLLVDLHGYALEIVRAAVAGGSRAIDVRYDADDVTLDLDGAPLSPDELPRLLDHVLDPDGLAAPHKRLLALGINAALGLDPASVDLVAGGRARVRWTRALLDAGKAPELEVVAAPADWPAERLRVHVRRRLGWDVLRAAVAGSVPREIELIAHATHDLPVPLTLAGQPFPRPPRAPALVRVRFDVPGARRAILEIVPASSGPPAMAFLERGVRLVERALELTPSFPPWPNGGINLPARVLVDVDALPTNASRSALREDAALPLRAAEGALGAFLDALRGLAAVAFGRGEVPVGVEVVAADPAACEDALGAVALLVEHALRKGAALPAELRAVLDLPLLRDGSGHPLALSALPIDGAGVLHVWSGASPLGEELAPWTRFTVWRRGRVAERLLLGVATSDAGPLVERARAGVERRRRLLARAPSRPVLPASLGLEIEGVWGGGSWGSGPSRTAAGDPQRSPPIVSEGQPSPIRASFDVRDGELNGLRGEVAIVSGAVGARKIHAYVEGRCIEVVPIDEAILPLPIEAAVSWEGRLLPRFAYDGIEPDGGFRRAVHYAAVVAIFALDHLLERLTAAHDASGPARLRPVSRAAIATLMVAAERLELAGAAHAPPLATFQHLHSARIWPTTEPHRWESVMSLLPPAGERGVIAVASPGTLGRAPDGRPVITARGPELDALVRALHGPELLPYDGAIIGPDQAAARDGLRDQALAAALSRPGEALGPILRLVRPGRRALAAAGRIGRVTFCHAGRVLAAEALPAELGPIAIAVDDDAFVPTPAWDGLRSRPAPGVLGGVEREYCERLVAALEGDPEGQRRLGITARDEAIPAVRSYLLDRAGALRRRQSSAAVALAERIELLPLLTMLDEQGAPVHTSLAGLTRAHPPPALVPVLREPPGFETLGWRPLLVSSDEELAAISGWTRGRAAFAESALPARRALALADRDRRAFLSGPVQDPRDPGDLAEPGAPMIFVEDDRTGGISVAAALPRAALAASSAWVDVLFCGRALCRRALPLPVPVVARIGLTVEAHTLSFRDLSPAGVERVNSCVAVAATALAHALIARACGPGKGGLLFGDLGALRLIGALLAQGQGPRAKLDWMAAVVTGKPVEAAPISSIPEALRSNALLWPTAQGEERPFGALRVAGGALYTGGVRHVPWRAVEPATELDAPILHVPATPEGDAVKAILAAIGQPTRDISEALAGLQRRRAQAEPLEVPRLPGAPAHPALRAELARLRVAFAVGELEIIEGPASEIHLIDLSGAPRPVSATMPFPVRLVARVDTIDTSTDGVRAILKKLGRAAFQLLVSLEPRLDEMPEFVRAHLRLLVCDAVAGKKRIARRALQAKVFQDVGGAFRSLEELRDSATPGWWCTNDPPPYPRDRATVLRLSEAEMRKLGTAIPLKNFTAILRRELWGERRAAGPQVAEVVLLLATRAKCLRVVTIDEAGMTGEVGLLAPEHADARGIVVFVDRRSLCTLKDGASWPIVAVIDDPAAPANRAFDGLRTTEAGLKVLRVARAAAGRALAEMISPPPDALAVRWFTGKAATPEGLLFAGAIWLPAAWPGEPRVHVRVPGGARAPRSLVAVEAPRYLFGDVPVGGELLVSADGPWHAVASVAMHAAASMAREAKDPGDAVMAAYLWDLRLLGCADIVPPPAAAGDGRPIGADEVLAELAERRCLWVSDQRGVADGAFPEATPRFVLADGSPLVEVLRRRAAPGVLRELAAATTTADAPLELTPIPDPEIRVEPAPAEGSWLQDLWEAVRSFFGDEPPVETALTGALEVAITRLGLVGVTAIEVREARSGRPIRYEVATRRLLVNPSHRALAWLGPRTPDDVRAMALLTAAAVSEINRELVEVTDEEERRVLGVLLAEAARSR